MEEVTLIKFNVITIATLDRHSQARTRLGFFLAEEGGGDEI